MLGKYNLFLDELGHIVLAIGISSFLYFTNHVSFAKASFLFLLAIAIDLDHLLNPILAKLLNIYGTVLPSKQQHGYTIKILHGIDLYFLYSLIVFAFTKSFIFAFGVFLTLTVHHLWDFIVYDHTWKELLLVTRAYAKFKPGTRKNLKGLIF